MIYGLDSSNYSGVPSREAVAGLYADGHRFAIVGTQHEGIARSTVTRFLEGNFYVGLYLYPLYDASDAQRVRYTTQIARDFGLRLIFDDVEWNEELQGPEPGPDVVLPALRNRINRIDDAGFEAGIYTGEPYWKRMTGNSAEFSHLKLWHAWHFFDRHVPDFGDFRSYGGWDRPTIWQYRDTHSEHGFSIDANVAETAFWEDDMELAKKEHLIAKIVATLKRPDYSVLEAGTDPVTNEPIIEVLSGVATDDAIRIRVR